MKRWLHIVSFVLVIIGGINWGLFGLLGFDLVDWLFSSVYTIAEIVYVLVGAAAVYLAVTHLKECKICKKAQ